MLLGQVVKLDPLAMFLNCLGESSLSYRSLPTWLDLVPHGLHWLHVLEVERVRDSDVVVGMVVVVGILPRLLLSAPSAHQLHQVAAST